ncbi:hypothetical protein GGS21DRAFT_500908 [Xylaria nigripes]|nr:hypothetical protein GGS21DRAFT_500908 [Xylaria nigripes]
MSPAMMSPLSPLRHRYSPFSWSPSSPLYQQWKKAQANITQDSRDVLAQRLNDLATRLSQDSHVEDESIKLLHAKVNELENALYTPERRPAKTKTERSGPRPLYLVDDRGGSDNSRTAPDPADLLLLDAPSLASPAQSSPSAKKRPNNRDDTKAKPRTSGVTVAQAEQVIAEAQNLHKELEIVISNLRDRQEETEHIHSLLITRLERAAQRIIYLEKRIQDLESERKGNETEMLNLQIQLKAIEVQCLGYVPKGADEELHKSIDAWKMEWSALKQKRARDKEQLSDTSMSRDADLTPD